MPSPAVLSAHGLEVHYGPIPALRGVELSIPEACRLAIVGRNGAGKSTALRALAGAIAPSAGRIELDGEDITQSSVADRIGWGLALVPEGRGLFPELTVKENLVLGAFHRHLSMAQIDEEVTRVTERFPRLRERISQTAGSMSGGEQQMLAIARGLMTSPRLLLVDEPSLGLAPLFVEEIYDLFGSLREHGLGVVVVEQYVEVALNFADHAYVLDKGVVGLSGPSADMLARPDVIEIYMGGRT